jgi:two-component system, OmpR family, phosphate regulon sensor histidine kinase PhoR
MYHTLKLTTDVVGAAKGSLLLLDAQGRTLQRWITARDMDERTQMLVARRVLEGGLAGWVVAHKQAALILDTLTDARWVKLEGDDLLRVRSAICVPFFVDGAVRGVMTLEHPEPQAFAPETVWLAEAIAQQASAALRNAQLFEQAQMQQRQLQGVLASISDALIVLDDEWRVLMMNPAAETLFDTRFNPENPRLPAAPVLDTFWEMFLSTNNGQAQWAFDLRDEIGRRDFIVNIAVLHQYMPYGSYVHYVVAFNDVTSLKDLARLRTHMIQMASHDLKNPLGVLMSYLGMLEAESASGRMPSKMILDSMQRVVGRMQSLIANLLNVQRAEMPLQPELFDPVDMVRSIIARSEANIAARGHTLITKIPAQMQSIKADRTLIAEAMHNLVENAIKYTPNGGKITVETYIVDSRFYFTVIDTGIGIPEDQQPLIFQKYFRARPAAASEIEGTGVGLNLVKEVIEQHGGSVSFTSKEGVGSTFSFWLPILS